MKNNVIKLTFDKSDLDEYNAHYFLQHPRAKKPQLTEPYHPSINKWMILKRMAMNALKGKWRQFIIWFIEQKGLSNRRIERCEITVTSYYSTNARHDPDNSVPKFILDGMVESGLIVDDDSKHVLFLGMKCGVDPDRPRTEIEIKIYK